MKKKQDEQRKHLEAFITRFKAKASKASQAQSRVKALAKMQPIAAAVEDQRRSVQADEPGEGAGEPADPHRRRERGLRAGQADPARSRSAHRPGRPHRAARPERQRQVDVRQADRGPARADGRRRCAACRRSRSGSSPSISSRISFQAETPYEYMTELLPDATEAQRRTRLGTYGFSFDKADTKCENLSGGEKARLLMMLTTFKGPHLLILDEPTNHLDVDSREALIHALNDYEGAVILISHDRHLVEASRRPAVDRARRHGEILRRRHGQLSRVCCCPSARSGAAGGPMVNATGRAGTERGRMRDAQAAGTARRAGAAQEGDASGREAHRAAIRRDRQARRGAGRSRALREGPGPRAEARDGARPARQGSQPPRKPGSPLPKPTRRPAARRRAGKRCSYFSSGAQARFLLWLRRASALRDSCFGSGAQARYAVLAQARYAILALAQARERATPFWLRRASEVLTLAQARRRATRL